MTDKHFLCPCQARLLNIEMVESNVRFEVLHSVYEERCLLGRDTVYSGGCLPMFCRNELPPFSGLKSKDKQAAVWSFILCIIHKNFISVTNQGQ
jgi:hypothetical protein